MASRTTPTGRRPAAPKASAAPKAPPAPKERKPQAHFSFVQAAKEREEGEPRPEPFIVELDGGEFVTLRDPEDLGWQEAAALDLRQPFLVMQTILSEDDYDTFLKVDYKIPDLQAMQRAWAEHYGLEEYLGNSVR